MSNTDIIKNFIGLQDVIITNIQENAESIEIFMQLEVKEHECPCCHSTTKKIHDYRVQRVTDVPYFNKKVIFILRKRRYVCPHCGKRFAEKNTFLPKYHQMTNRLVAYIISRLKIH